MGAPNLECTCGGRFEPVLDLTWDTTHPDPRAHATEVSFMCGGCMAMQLVSYDIPMFTGDMVRNVLRDIKAVVKVNSWHLLTTITLNTSGAYAIAGTRYALRKLEFRGLVEDVIESELSFRLTLHGWIALNHSAY